jgi:AraC family transcriptional regulator of adaptative response/methylated-DNA-[protein]-cysteine methyltransferase
MNTQHFWQAVLDRDPHYDGVFVYGVRSTGIYCRPTCPSRRPRPDNVVFFAQPAQAQAAGFRPCRRCAPDQPHAPDVEIARAACALIEAADGERLTLHELGERLHLSPFHVQRVFKRVMGVSPAQMIRQRLRERAKTALRQQPNVSAATYEAGYGSSSHFYAESQAHFGMTPAAYQQGGAGMDMHYTVVECALGWMLVARTPRGICAVTFGDTSDALEAALRAEFPAAALQRADEDALLRGWSDVLRTYLAGGAPAALAALPLDMQGTAFQARIWQVLRDIPGGETRSYGEIARQIGQPTAARAVARACATNRIALLIPCHRVLREGGGLSGYRWGVERKAALLKREREGA